MFDDPEVREDLREAYRSTWEHIAAPGTWWTGPQRVAIAAATRGAAECELCQRRKAALSPYTVDGEHDHAGELPEAIVDIVHRIATDSARLTKDWFDGLDLDEAKYVELLAVVSWIVSVDRWHYTVGHPLPPLPEPQPGEPTRTPPDAVRDIGAWVKVLDHRRAKGAAKLFPLPMVPNVVLSLSLVPAETRQLQKITAAQYLKPSKLAHVAGDTGRSLGRAQMEFIAARVSSINECFY